MLCQCGALNDRFDDLSDEEIADAKLKATSKSRGESAATPAPGDESGDKDDDSTPASASTGFSEVFSALERKCTFCHNLQNPKGGLDLSSFESIMKGGNSGSIVVVGKPEESLIFTTLNGAVGEISKMPLNIPPMEEADIQLISKWIAAGATDK